MTTDISSMWERANLYQLEHFPEYRAMVARHMCEMGDLANRHAEERVRLLAKIRRAGSKIFPPEEQP